jgi:hypothetical protein
MARADGSLRSLFARLSRIDLLVIDDFLNRSATTSGTSARTAARCAPRS